MGVTQVPTDLVTITELARLQGISTDRLRHYDRIGLFKPEWRDPETGLRYYSLSSSKDTLSTILELRALDMSLNEIADYLNGRNLKKSLDAFKGKQRDLSEQINRLLKLKEIVDCKVSYLEEAVSLEFDFNEIAIKHFPERKVLCAKRLCETDEECNLQAIRLSSMLHDAAPITGSNRVLLSFSKREESDRGLGLRVGLSVERAGLDFGLDSESTECSLEILDEANYACVYRWGDPYDVEVPISRLLEHCKMLGLRLSDEILEVFEIDQSVTDVPEERVYEIQVKVL